jgi:hypothetical protein
MHQDYPIPEAKIPVDRMHRLFWEPLAYDENNRDYFIEIAEKANWNYPTIPTDFIAGTALRLTRTLAY